MKWVILILALVLGGQAHAYNYCGDAVGCWLFTSTDYNGGAGTTVADASPNSNTGTFTNGTAWGVGGSFSGYYANFDGANDKITCGTGLNNLPASNMSVYTRVKIDTLDGTIRRLISKQSTSPGHLVGWSVNYTSSGATINATVLSIGYTTANGEWRSPNNSINTTGTFSILWTYTGSGTPIVYIDGQSKTVTEAISPAVTRRDDTGVALNLGNFDNLDRGFDGQMYESAIFDSIIDSTDASLIHDYGLNAAEVSTSTYSIIRNSIIRNSIIR
jgi:hypothetical protein